MAGVVTTSLVVQFGSEDDAANYILTAEIDSREDGYNGGNTSFLGGDSPVFLVYKSEELSLLFETSTGGIASHATGQIAVKEWLTFAGTKTQRLSKPPLGSVTLERFAGATGGKVVGNDVTLPSNGVAVYRASYTSKFYAYRMTNIPTTLGGESSFPVVVLITGTAA